MSVVLVSLILGALIVLYFFLTKNYKYWQKRGIPCVEGVLPGLGNMFPVLSLRMPFNEHVGNMYDDNREHSMVGFYNMTSPALIVIEPELVKTVLQANFASFSKNVIEVDPELDPLIANNPFVLTGDRWLAARKRLTYAFSSMRLKVMLESVKPVCVMLENYLHNKISKTGKTEVELKDLCSRFTAQVVASAAFGVDGFCFDDTKNKQSFRKIGAAILEPNLRNRILFSIMFVAPILNKFFRISVVPQEIDHFFRTLVAEIMEQRRKDGIPRNDFLRLMVELEKTEGDNFDLELITANALSFLIDGYDTSSTVMSFAIYQLATHPDVQERLREEVISVLNKYDGEMTYESLKEMTYMDQVLNESQRVVPTVGFLSKICTKEFELKGSDGLVCRVKPGTEVRIPTQGLHLDPRFWKDPKVFDPERFNPERKQSIDRFTFLPFSDGPRSCPGMRMAQLQIKAGLAALLSKYSLEFSPRTKLPLKMTSGSLLPTPQGGLWVYVRQL